MIKILSLSLTAILFLAASSTPSNQRVRVPVSQEIPKAATVEIVLVNAPGINDEGSKWEITYEFRIINQAAEWQAWKQGKFKAGSGERVGELIKEGTVKETLRSPANRKVVLKIPFSPKILERLRNQPRERIKTTPGQITPEEIKLLKEQETEFQVFLFYPVINIYDAKLKKNFIIPASRTWAFEEYPQARFEMTVEINDDGTYRVKSSWPPKTRASN
ncbi:MAG: hypothetical protein H0U54_05035 [Acidobacteria bacterium]|nr:hypothetical protein [Acidobacteriota bacterium]